VIALLASLFTFVVGFVAGAAWMLWLHAPLRASAQVGGDWRRVDKLRILG
jgi:hypothetical protein